MEEEIKGAVSELLGQYGWMFVAGLGFLLFKSTLDSMVEGIKVFLGNDLNTDDVIHFEGRPGRVVRVGVWKTVFFIYKVETIDGHPVITGGTKLAIQNDQLKTRMIEKPLPELNLKYWSCTDKRKNGKS